METLLFPFYSSPSTAEEFGRDGGFTPPGCPAIVHAFHVIGPISVLPGVPWARPYDCLSLTRLSSEAQQPPCGTLSLTKHRARACEAAGDLLAGCPAVGAALGRCPFLTCLLRKIISSWQ